MNDSDILHCGDPFTPREPTETCMPGCDRQRQFKKGRRCWITKAPIYGLTPPTNPKGIGSFSPALARFRERPNAGVATREGSNPERVAYQRLMKVIQLFQSCDFPVNSPWVARSAQPRADRFNPFGIGLNPRCPRTAFGIPLKTAKNLFKGWFLMGDFFGKSGAPKWS